VDRDLSRTSGGWAVVVLVVAGLSLGACGRKGPLDLPPTANAVGPAAAEPESDAAAKTTPLFSPNSSDVPVAPKGPKKPFILDPLLGN
jgi:predicted small lipoprotein YifL